MEQHSVHVQKKPVTWILLADGKRAQVYTRKYSEKRVPLPGRAKRRHYDEGGEYAMEPIPGMTLNAESPEEYDFGRKRPGRMFESGNPAHHAAEPRETIEEKIRRRFMETLARYLSDSHRKKRFDRLVLVAPAKAMGELKEALPQHVLSSVIVELCKDLTHAGKKSLASQLEGIA